MSVSKNQLENWASPRETEFLRYADSEADLFEITENVTNLRRQFLVDTVNRELLVRSGVVVEPQVEVKKEPNKEVMFTDIPLKLVLQRNVFVGLAIEWGNRQCWPPGFNELKAYWNRLLSLQSDMVGHPLFASKYSDSYYAANKTHKGDRKLTPKQLEQRFVDALESSQTISDSGYPVRFLMAGAHYLQNAALDLETVEAWSKTRGKIGEDSLECDWGFKKYYPYKRTPMEFWPSIVKAKRQYDQAHHLETYADVTHELDDGIYVSSYIPQEIVDSEEFVTFDDVYKIARKLGYNAAMGTRAFGDIVYAAINDWRLASDVRNAYLSSAQYVHPGIIFLEKTALHNVLEKLDEKNMFTAKVCNIAEELLYIDEKVTYEFGTYSDLVFGRKN